MVLKPKRGLIISGGRNGFLRKPSLRQVFLKSPYIRRIKEDGFLVKKGMRLGVGGDLLVQCNLDNSAIIPNDIPGVNKVVDSGGGGNSEKSDDEPPAAVLSGLSTAQKQAFLRLWSMIPIHLRAIHFDFGKALWTAGDIDVLGALLCKYAHRFSKHRTDLGHTCHCRPFPHHLKKDAQPVRQRPYRHSPVLAAQVKTEIDKLVLAGILRRSYSNWTSPLVVIAKADGRIRLTCNYK